MKKRFRILSLILSACMMLSLTPMSAFAAEVPEQEITADSTIEFTDEIETSEEEEKAEDVAEAEDAEAPAEEASEESEIKPEEEQELVDEEAETEEELLTEGEEPAGDSEEEELGESKYFTVDENGKLKLRESIDSLTTITADMISKASTSKTQVTTIPAGIFSGNNTIEKITIPSSITTFEKGAFQSCRNLKTVAFENDTTAATVFPEDLFRGDVKLQWRGPSKAFKIPKGITTIDKNAFADCAGITGIEFSEDLTTISEYAFSGCSNLQNLNDLNKSKLATIGEYAFKGTAIDFEVEFPTTLRYIGSNAFYGCRYLGKLNLSKLSLTADGLAAGCFAGSGLTGIVLPDSCTAINERVFEDCSNLSSVTVGSDTQGRGVATIKAQAFKNCANLTEVTLNNSVTTVENDAFYGCSSLKKISIKNQDSDTHLTDITLSADSFPANKGLVIYSYSGTGEEWAGSHSGDGIIYKSLFTGKGTKITGAENGNLITVTPNNDISIGDTVTVTTKPAENYKLISLTHGVDNTKKFVESNGKFVVAAADINSDNQVQINGAFANTSTNDTRFSFERVGGEKPTYYEGVYEVSYPTANQISQLKIKAKNATYGAVDSNPWLWNFSSSDSKKVSVDANGKLRLLKTTGTNPVTITASLKADSNIKITLKVTVEEETEFSDVTGVSFGDENNKLPYNFTAGEESGIAYVQTSKRWLEAATAVKQTRDVDVHLTVVDKKGQNIQSTFKWVSDDTGVVKVASANTTNNDNTLKLCGLGETTVTATSTLDSKKSITFIVRVIDMTPYVENDTLVVNAPATTVSTAGAIEEGIEFNLIQAYGGEIQDKNMSVVKKDGNSYTSLVNDFALEKVKVRGAAGNVQRMQIAVKQDSAYYSKNATYTNIYLKVLVGGYYYYVHIPKLTIVNKKPAPTVKLTGKINTFYTRDAKEQTDVVATIKTPAGYEFDSSVTPYLESIESSDSDGYFAKNFKVTVDEKAEAGDFSVLHISMRNNTLDPDHKVITTGNLCFAYRGHYGTTKLKITVPTGKTVPTLAFDKTSVSTHLNASSQKFELGIYDKKAKANLDLDSSYDVEYASKSNDYFVSGSAKEGLSIDETNDKVVVQLRDYAPQSNVKAFVIVNNDNWAESITLPLTVNVAKTVPAATIGNNKVININTASATSNFITFDIKSDFVDTDSISFTEFATTEKKAAAEQANKISVEYKNGKIVAILKETPKFGTYKFAAAYTAKYAGSNTTFSGNVVVSVKVYETKPSIKLKASTLTLNDYLQGVVDATGAPVEIASTTYTVQNTSADAANKVSFKITDVTNAKAPYTYSAGSAPISVKFEDGNMKVYLNQRLGATKKYKLTDVAIDGIAAPEVAFTVKSINAQPTISVSAKGGINVLEADSAVTYTVNIKNFNGTVDASSLELVREDKKVSKDYIWEYNKANFHYELKESNGKTVKLEVKNANKNTIESRKYTLLAQYKFGTGANAVTSNNVSLSVTPKQTMPKVTQSATTARVYAGTPSQYATVRVEPKAGSSAKITNVVWSTKTSKKLQNAFQTPEFDAATGTLKIQIKNSALLKKNSTYTLTYNIECDGQLAGTTGTTFTVKVTVK